MIRTASAEWFGTLREGEGKLTTQSGVLSNTDYSFGARFENRHEGTNPEELIGGAHAGCFTMALVAQLQKLGFKPAKLHTEASVFLEKDGEGWSIRRVELSTYGQVAGASEAQFQEAAELAKSGCPVSRLLRAEITLQARLLADEPEVLLSKAV